METTATTERGAEPPEVKEPPAASRGLSAAASAADGDLKPERDGTLDDETASTVQDATEWLLSSFDENAELLHVLDLNVGTPGEPKWIKWTIQAVDGPLLRRIRARAADSIDRQQRGKTGALGGAEAAFRANLECVVEGTVDPDLKAVAQHRGLADPTVIVEEAFKRKQGLVDQVAGEIMTLSGYDDEDVRDSLEVRAASGS